VLPPAQNSINSSNSSNVDLSKLASSLNQQSVAQKREERRVAKRKEQEMLRKLSMEERIAYMKEKKQRESQGHEQGYGEESGMGNNFSAPETDAPSYANDDDGDDAPANVSVFDI